MSHNITLNSSSSSYPRERSIPQRILSGLERAVSMVVLAVFAVVATAWFILRDASSYVATAAVNAYDTTTSFIAFFNGRHL